MDKGADWLTGLTGADGEVLQFDPSLLEDEPAKGEKTEDSEDDDSTDGGRAEDLYDELGRTPPRMSMARNRKWSADRRHTREMEKRGGILKNPGLKWPARPSRGNSPKAGIQGSRGPPRRQAKQATKKINYARDLLEGGWEPASDPGGSYPPRRRHDDEEEVEEEDEGRHRSNTISSSHHPARAALSLGPSSFAGGQHPAIKQADSLPMGYRVETANRFMSLSSRPVQVASRDAGGGGSIPGSGSTTPTGRKRSASLGQDRQAFFKILGALYKSQKKLERESSQVAMEEHEQYERQMSKDQTRWQNELKDLIWLELRAWFAGTEAQAQDEWLIRERSAVDVVGDLVNTFRFRPDDPHWERKLMFQFSSESSTSNSLQTDVYYDAQESIERRLSSVENGLEGAFKGGLEGGLEGGLSRFHISEVQQEVPSLREEDRQDTLTQDQVDGAGMAKPLLLEEQDEVCDSLDVNSKQRISSTQRAMERVQEVLRRMEYCETLFPSSQQLEKDHPTWGMEEYKARVRVLCMWYNITTQLHHKIDQLGKILIGLGGRLHTQCPWPLLDRPATDEGVHSVNSDPPTESRPSTAEVSREVSLHNLTGSASPTKVVKFQVNDQLLNSSPSDSNNSTDSGAGSSTNELKIVTDTRRQDSVLSTASLNSSVSEYSFVEGASPYRKYVEKQLKTKGIRKTLSALHRVTRGPLHRAKIALEKPNPAKFEPDNLLSPNRADYHPHLEERLSSLSGQNLSEDDEELARFGCWSPHFQALNLPSFRAVYLFLCRVPRDIIHECLKIRLEQKPAEPSEWSLKQLMRECKEALRLAVAERQKYIGRVRAAVYDLEKDRIFLEAFEQEMEDFDDNLTQTLDVYLEYLRSFVTMIQGDSSLLISTYQKNLLEQEWDFIKNICPHIPGGEARAGNTFCQMACGMLASIGDFLRMGTDEIVKNMYELSDSIDEEDMRTRKSLFEAFRGFQSLFSEARERAVKAIAFAKLLRKDLEVSAEFGWLGSPVSVMRRLEETDHVQVLAPHSKQHLIFVPAVIAENQEHILQLLDMHCGQESGLKNENKGYLVLMEHQRDSLGVSLCSEAGALEAEWSGPTKHVKPTAETTISLSQIQVSGVLLVAPTASSLEPRRKEFSRTMKEVLELKQEQRATSQAIANSLDQVKHEALQLRSQICEELAMVESSDLSALEQADKETLARRMREILHQCYKFGFEFHRELDRLITGESSRVALAQGVIHFSMQWMRFVLKWCERGKGFRPDWANKGIEFLYFAANPAITKFLSDAEFMEFKTLTEDCHIHVVGDKDTPRRDSVSPNPLDRDGCRRPYSRSGSRNTSRHTSPHRSMSRDDGVKAVASPDILTPGEAHDRMAMPPPQSPLGAMSRSERRRSSARKSLQMDEVDLNIRVPPFALLPWKDRVARSVDSLEAAREEQRREAQIIGQVLDQTQPEDRIHIKARLVRFSWQRGVKIGQGHFGKVYTAINNETGDIMAMKEIPLQPNDHKTLKNVADELKIFEAINHPHLINHFGVEIHREEMLIFMEYCPEGTLESLCLGTENGLEEVMVRRYTRQLLEAVACLHEHGVVHRDIKGANIFLTEELKTLKLGDFGCAVKIKAHTTMPGELQGFVGTQAYMAPEVFTRNMSEGHGRAADIWSGGCVVLEMVQGKRPWAELESNYQIMFKVGMGQSPVVPDHLSDEGKDFLSLMFVHQPGERAEAQDLLSHNFIKIDDEEENPSLPLFASISAFSEMRRTLVRKDSGKY